MLFPDMTTQTAHTIAFLCIAGALCLAFALVLDVEWMRSNARR